MTIAIILGTRPEIIKMAPVIRECQRRGLNYSIIHTGQQRARILKNILFTTAILFYYGDSLL